MNVDAKTKTTFRDLVSRLLEYYAVSMSPTLTVPYYPIHTYIEPTNACNLRCIHCYHSKRGVGGG